MMVTILKLEIYRRSLHDQTKPRPFVPQNPIFALAYLVACLQLL